MRFKITALLLVLMVFGNPVFALDFDRIELGFDTQPSRAIEVGIADIVADGKKEIIVLKSKPAELSIFFLNNKTFEEIKTSLPDSLMESTLWYLARVKNKQKYSPVYLSGRSFYYFPEGRAGLDTHPLLLADLPSSPSLGRNGSFSFLTANPDFNNDGWDELLFPADESVGFLTRTESGAFSGRLIRAISPEMTLHFSISSDVSYRESVHTASRTYLSSTFGYPGYSFLIKDLNSDGRLDLLNMRGEQYFIYLQGNNLDFREEPDFVISRNTFLYHAQNIADINRDGVPDMVHTESSFDIMSPLTDVEVSFGRINDVENRELGNMVGQFFRLGSNKHVAGKQIMPGSLVYDAYRQTVFGIGATKAVLDVQPPALEVGLKTSE